jgi:hypothetical protein
LDKAIKARGGMQEKNAWVIREVNFLGAVLVTIIAILIGFYILGKSACMNAYDLCKQRNFAGIIVIGQNFTSVYIVDNGSGFVLNCSEFYQDVGECDFLRYVKWCEKNK